MADRAEQTKLYTEKLLRNTEAVLTPNPGNRAEDFIFEKIEKKKPTRLSNLEYLGLDMIEVSTLVHGEKKFVICTKVAVNIRESFAQYLFNSQNLMKTN